MSIELWSLFFTACILYFVIFIQQIAKDRIYGAKYALSNREAIPEDKPTVLIDRLTRLVGNHIEGLAVFTVLVIIAALSGVSNHFTQYAAVVYALMRLMHFIFYATGITPFRSFAWGIGYLGALPVFIYGLVSVLF